MWCKLDWRKFVDKSFPPGPFVVGNRPTAINPRRPKDCDSSLLFRSPKALKVPSRHHVEVRVKPASGGREAYRWQLLGSHFESASHLTMSMLLDLLELLD